jgi:hypothetical protein
LDNYIIYHRKYEIAIAGKMIFRIDICSSGGYIMEK